MNKELMKFYTLKGLEEVKRDIKKHKEITSSPMEEQNSTRGLMDLLCRVESCIKALEKSNSDRLELVKAYSQRANDLEYENEQLNYMVDRQLDYYWNKADKESYDNLKANKEIAKGQVITSKGNIRYDEFDDEGYMNE